MDKKSQNNYANQKNPNNSAYWSSRNTDKASGWQGKSSSSMSKQEQDNRSRQLNPNHPSYYSSRETKTINITVIQGKVKAEEFILEGIPLKENVTRPRIIHEFSKELKKPLELTLMDNNRANQLNPNNFAFWKSRGYSDRPTGWIDLLGTLASVILTISDNNNRSNQLNPNNSTFWKSRGSTKP
ncbi:hypothetical protein NQ315_009363 [Exocentrus adspersus]|uniref:Uncharacterized protein n=1 Tax=Exocentrus adspersus TaxID=1586481 RepID=A0AAV8WFW5_9CUCU|nr:hypothetical protein NQ315_009363 [Exocentrus adspersus]